MSRHSASAASSSGRTLTRVEIFSEKIRVHPAVRKATSWLSSSWPLVEQRAYPIRIGGAAGPISAAGTGGSACQGAPGRRPAGTGTSRRSRSAGTRMNRAVWYLAATFPPRVRHGEGAITSHAGQSCASTASAASSGVRSTRPVSQNPLAEPEGSARNSENRDLGGHGIAAAVRRSRTTGHFCDRRRPVCRRSRSRPPPIAPPPYRLRFFFRFLLVFLVADDCRPRP